MGPTALVLMFLNRDTTHQFIILIYYLQCKIHSNLFTHIRTYPFIPVFLLVTYSFKYRRLVGSFTVQKYRNGTICSHQSPKNDPVANSSDFMNFHGFDPAAQYFVLFEFFSDKSVIWLPWVWLCCHKKLFLPHSNPITTIFVWQRLPV